MARIPVYTREVNAPDVRTATVQIDDSIARGIGNLGASIGQVAARFQERQNQQQDFDDDIKRRQYQVETDNAFAEAQKQMPANATGFHDQFMASRVQSDEKFFNSISPRNRDRFKAEWNGVSREKISGAAADLEYAARGRYETDEIGKSLDTWMSRIASDPSVKDAAVADLTSQVAKASSVSAEAKRDFEQKVKTNLATAEFRALYGSDPDAARKQLGIPSPATGATAQSGDYYNALRLQESGGNDGAKAATSSATGRYQFLDSTWKQVAKAHPELGLTAGGRTDPEQQERAIRAFTADNEKVLSANGIEINNANRYAAHFLGAGGAVALISAMKTDPGKSAASLLPDAAAANKTIFYHKDGSPRSVSEVYALQTKRFGGDQVSTAVSPADPRWSDIPYAQRLALANQAETQQRENQAFYRAGLESQVQDASAAFMTTGRYDGALPTQQDFVNAYGGQRGPQEYSAFQRVVETGQQIDAVKTMTPAEQRSMLDAEKPVGAGPGFATENAQYETLQKAVEINQQQRQADPAAYVQTVFPRVKSAWDAAGQGPAAFQTALAATAAAQTQIGIPAADQRLLPKEVAKKAADTFKQPDLSQGQRIGAIASTVFATNDPTQQSAIFRQLVDAGLPDMTEGAVRAFARGDQGAAERLFQAAMVNPKDLPGKIAASEGDISQTIQDEVMADGEVGDLFYGLSFGQSENLVTAERDGKLLTRAVQLRMAGGEDLDAAVAGARKDLFGAVQVVDNSSAQALIPEAADANAFSAGVDAMLPRVEQAIRAVYPEPDASVTGTARALVSSSRDNRIKDVIVQGAFRNAAGGFAFIDPFTGKAIAGSDGKPLTFTLDQILAAGQASPTRKTGDPLADANNPNSRFNQARSVTPPAGAPAADVVEPQLATQPTDAASGVPATAAPLSLQEQLSDAQRSAVSAAVRAISAGADPKAITDRLRKAGVPKELWPE